MKNLTLNPFIFFLLCLLAHSTYTNAKKQSSNTAKNESKYKTYNDTYFNTAADYKKYLKEKGESVIGPDLNDYAYNKKVQEQLAKDFIKDSKSWDQLQKLLSNEFVDLKKLGYKECRQFKRPKARKELKNLYPPWRLKQQNQSLILNTIYRWNVYEFDNNTLCIELLTPVHKFLNKKETKTLILANKDRYPESLNFKNPIKISELIYSIRPFDECINPEFKQLKTSTVSGNDCMTKTTYILDGVPSLIQKKIRAVPKTELENFIEGFEIDCSKKQNDNWPPHNNKELKSPYICLKNKVTSFGTNEDNNIELYFTTVNTQYNDVAKFISVFKEKNEKQRRQVIKKEMIKFIGFLGVNKSNNNSYNLGLIDDQYRDLGFFFTNLKSREIFRRDKSIPFLFYKDANEIKDKLILYVKFVYGENMIYYAKYDLNHKITIVKLKKLHN